MHWTTKTEIDSGAEYQDNDYKYFMQDTGRLYLGARYSYEELLSHEMVPFKLKAIIEHYILKDTLAETTLESQFFYMEKEQFSYKTFLQLKVKVKASVLVSKHSILGKEKIVYRDRIIPLEEFVSLNLAVKKKSGVKIQEIIISKLAMMTFSV